MSQVEVTKQNIVTELLKLCAHCQSRQGLPHRCQVRELAVRVRAIRGVPLIVDDQFRGVLSPQYV